MDNPWRDLPVAPPYVLPIDAKALKGARNLQLDALPVPYVGSPAHARVYLLALNPGYAADAEKLSLYAAEQNRRALTFESTHPFWSLDPDLAGTGGYEWWRPRLRRLAEEIGWESVRTSVMCVQYFPYHSRTFSSGGARVPSQEFSFGLIRDAIAAGKPIVITRSKDRWIRAVPALAAYPYYELTNPRAVYLTPANMRAGTFVELVNRLREHR